MKRFFLSLSLVVASVAVFLALAETAARLFLNNRTALVVADENTSELGRTDSRLGFRLKPGHVSRTINTNSHGLRGPEISPDKPADALRLICLGGSTTFGHGAPDDAGTYPALLEVFLRQALSRPVEVINAGVPAYTSWHTRTRLDIDVLPLRPDVALLMDGLNDIMNARAVSEEDNDPAANAGLLAPDTPAARLDRLCSRLTFYAFIKSSLGRMALAGPKGPPPDRRELWSKGLARYEANTRIACARLKAAGVAPVLVNFPWMAPDQPVLDLNAERAELLSFGRALAETNRRLARDFAVPLIDPQPLFDELAATPCDKYAYFHDFMHFSVLGDIALAGFVADNLIDLGLVGEPRPAAAPPSRQALTAEAVRIAAVSPKGSGLPSARAALVPVATATLESGLTRGKPDGQGFVQITPSRRDTPGFLHLAPIGGTWREGCYVVFPRFQSGADRVKISCLDTNGLEKPIIEMGKTADDGAWSAVGARYLFSVPEDCRQAPLVISLRGENAQLSVKDDQVIFPTSAIAPEY